MPSRTSTHRHNLAGVVARPRLGFAIDILILAGLVLVPLAFRGRKWVAFYSQPKLFVLHLVALSIVVLWLFEAALDTRVDQQAEGSSIFDRARPLALQPSPPFDSRAIGSDSEPRGRFTVPGYRVGGVAFPEFVKTDTARTRHDPARSGRVAYEGFRDR